MTSAWNPDFVSTYFPRLDELNDPAALQGARDRIESYLRGGWSDEDMRPGSPVGDRVLTPFAHLLLALEIAAGRFMSDLDTGQIASGVVWNCDFVAAFLRNFAVQDTAGLNSAGIVRLVFAADEEQQIERRIALSINGLIFHIDLPFTGPLFIQRVGSAPMTGANHCILRDIGGGLYAADVRVVGPSGAGILANDQASTDMPVVNLVSASALLPFTAGSPQTSLAALATMARQTFPAAALTSRRSAISAVLRMFPELSAVYPTMPGDTVMLRSSVNPLGVGLASVDMHVRSESFDTIGSVTIRIPYNTAAETFVVRLRLPGNPLFIRDVTSIDNPLVALTPGPHCTVWSASLNPARCPLLTCAGTDEEALWLSFPMPKDTSGDALLTLAADDDGNPYANFTVRYHYDPTFPAIAARLGSPDEKPANAEILARPFIPVVLTKFHITYTKLPGVTVNVAAARAEILAYLRSLSSGRVFSSAKVADAVFYHGADDLISIEVRARVWWSAGNRVLTDSAAGPDVNLDAAESAARPVPAVLVDAVGGLAISDYVDPLLGTAGETMAAISQRTLCYIVTEDNITFSEQHR